MKIKVAIAIAALVCAIGILGVEAFSRAGKNSAAGASARLAISAPAEPAPAPSAPQINLSGLEDAVKEKAAETGIENLLNDQLPLTLNAKNVYPTVKELPGGPFSPMPLQLTAAQLDQPLAPGDYTINTLAFCSEYSEHRPGQGVAYVLGPYEGKAASAIGELIWRGTVQYNIAPAQLQTVSWAIQSGLTYQQMPQSYQAIIDQVIPDLKSEITGDFMQNLQASYNNYAKTLKLPPLDTVLSKAGAPGTLALSAEKERAILLQQGTSDQLKDQTLYQGQESGVYTPVKAEDGPWTERMPGVYMKLLIQGGNMATNNVMQIRVMPTAAGMRAPANAARFLAAKLRSPQEPAAAAAETMTALMKGMIGYSQGQGAQALGQVPVVSKTPAPPVSQGPVPGQWVGSVLQLVGTVTVIHPGSTTPVPLNANDPVAEGDKIQTGAGGRAELHFVDNTVLTMGENANLTVDSYVYDPDRPTGNKAQYGLLGGAFRYVSGLIAKKDDAGVKIDTAPGEIGIRGTEFILKSDGTPNNMEIDLISGAIALTPTGGSAGPTMTGPVQILVTPSGMQALPMTQAQYNSLLAQYFSGMPIA